MMMQILTTLMKGAKFNKKAERFWKYTAEIKQIWRRNGRLIPSGGTVWKLENRVKISASKLKFSSELYCKLSCLCPPRSI